MSLQIHFDLNIPSNNFNKFYHENKHTNRFWIKREGQDIHVSYGAFDKSKKQKGMTDNINKIVKILNDEKASFSESSQSQPAVSQTLKIMNQIVAKHNSKVSACFFLFLKQICEHLTFLKPYLLPYKDSTLIPYELLDIKKILMREEEPKVHDKETFHDAEVPKPSNLLRNPAGDLSSVEPLKKETPTPVEEKTGLSGGSGAIIEKEKEERVVVTAFTPIKKCPVDPSLIQYKDFISAQKQINDLLQRNILHYYVTPLPAKPSYRNNEGETVLLERPLYGRQAMGRFHSYHIPFNPDAEYEFYLEHLKNGGLPRDIHGCMHAVRATFLSIMQIPLFAKNGRPIEANPILIAAAIGCHDTARRDEGVDHYEQESAANLRELLESYNVPAEEMEIFVRSVADKDPHLHGREFVDDVQMNVHNSDSWEILRLYSLHSYRFNELKFDGLNLDFDYRYKLTAEVKLFVDQTENEELKKKLERESENYYLDLLRIFADTHREKKCYPLMMNLMQEALQVLEEKF